MAFARRCDLCCYWFSVHEWVCLLQPPCQMFLLLLLRSWLSPTRRCSNYLAQLVIIQLDLSPCCQLSSSHEQSGNGAWAASYGHFSVWINIYFYQQKLQQNEIRRAYVYNVWKSYKCLDSIIKFDVQNILRLMFTQTSTEWTILWVKTDLYGTENKLRTSLFIP